MDIGLTLTAFGAMMAGFFALAKLMLGQASKDRESDRKERHELGNAIRLMAKNSGKVATATEKSAAEAKQRNGHLGDLVSQGNRTTVQILNRLNNSAGTLAAEKNDGGLLVKTKDGTPLKVKT